MFLHCPTETVGCPEIYWHASSQHWTASDAILEKLFTLLTHSAVPHLQWLLSHTSSCHAPACTDYLWINAWAWGREQKMNPPTVSHFCYSSNTLPDHQSANVTQIKALAIVTKAAYMQLITVNSAARLQESHTFAVHSLSVYPKYYQITRTKIMCFLILTR